jgi:hypothetical protein
MVGYRKFDTHKKGRLRRFVKNFSSARLPVAILLYWLYALYGESAEIATYTPYKDLYSLSSYGNYVILESYPHFLAKNGGSQKKKNFSLAWLVKRYFTASVRLCGMA